MLSCGESVPIDKMDYAKALKPRKTWCVLGSETPPLGLSLLSWLIWDEVREVCLGERILTKGGLHYREWIRGPKEGI